MDFTMRGETDDRKNDYTHYSDRTDVCLFKMDACSQKETDAGVLGAASDSGGSVASGRLGDRTRGEWRYAHHRLSAQGRTNYGGQCHGGCYWLFSAGIHWPELSDVYIPY